jgi:hypothetical protein
VTCVKKDKKKCHVNSHVRASKFVFLHETYKMLFFPINLCTDIKYLDVRVKFYFRILIIQNYFFTQGVHMHPRAKMFLP